MDGAAPAAGAKRKKRPDLNITTTGVAGPLLSVQDIILADHQHPDLGRRCYSARIPDRPLLDADEDDVLFAAAAPAVPLTPQYHRTPASPSGNGHRSDLYRALNLSGLSHADRLPVSFLDSITPTPIDLKASPEALAMPPPIPLSTHHLGLAGHGTAAAADDDDEEEDLGPYRGDHGDLRIRSPNSSLRDSHDLSLPHRQVRDSLVANMLLSLDQFSMDQMHGSSDPPGRSITYDPFDDSAPAGTASSRNMTITSSRTATATAPTARIGGGGSNGGAGGHGHHYSYSSDYDGGDESTGTGGRASRGRRSNSSSGFQSSLGRISSMRETTNQRSQPSTPQRQMHSRGGRGSKSSSTSSINVGYAQVLGSQRWAHGFGGRSSSFDYGHRKPGLTHQSTAPAAIGTGSASGNNKATATATTTAVSAGSAGPSATSPWHIEFSNTFFSDEYDAAPTPTIPSGPRRFPLPPSSSSAASPPSATHANAPGSSSSYPRPPPIPAPTAQFLLDDPPPPPKSPGVVERKRSARSARSVATSSGRKNTMSRDRDHHLPPLSTSQMAEPEHESAPAPHVGYEKSKEPAPQAAPVKEKQGFFRRVFGIGSGSSNNTASGSSNTPGSGGSGSSNNAFSGSTSSARQHSSTSIDSQARSGPQSNPPSRDSHTSATHTLQKKPSSFFRRRKKSVTADEVPPIPAPLPAPSGASTTSSPPPRTSIAPPPIMLPSSNAVSSKMNTTTAAGSSGNNLNSKDLLASPAADPSPVSSLRRVMSPYLKSPTTPNAPGAGGLAVGVQSPLGGPPQTQTTASVERDERSRARGFSPDYEPPPSATIRSVDTNPTDSKLPIRDQPKRSATDELPTRRLKTPPRDPAVDRAGEPDATFLHDNSDYEPESPKATFKAPRQQSNNKLVPFPRDKKGKRPTADAASLSNSIDHPPPPPIPNRASGRDLARDLALKSTASATRLKALPSPSTDDDGTRDSLALPIEGARSNRSSQRLSHATSLPSLRIEGREMSPRSSGPLTETKPLDEPDVIVGDPTEDDMRKAQQIYDGNEDFIQKDRAAAWMGEEGPVRQRTLKAYMQLYDFSNISIIAALRQVCGRLVLRGETQQVDRILVAFSNQWCDCNSNHGFKAMDIIHTICYSIMLLNTDLHMADIEHKMTRSQFVKNTMGTVQAALEDSAPDAFDRELAETPRRASGDGDKRNFRLSLMPPARPVSGIQHGGDRSVVDECGPLVKAPFDGTQQAWEAQIESVLKDIYNSIRDEKLPLFGADPDRHPLAASSQSSLSVMNVLKRTPSVLSKAPSEGGGSSRGRMSENKNSRWSSKSRSRPRGFAGLNSSRTSFEDNNSVWSPTVSSATWSKYSLGRTQTSMSMDSFGSSWPRVDYQHSIGFATALGQAIIREEALGSGAASLISDDAGDSALLEDESLELAGPPWVKEGIVTHKHHLDGIDKKAKDRNWSGVFAVIQKGCLSLFSFHSSKSLGRKNRLRTSRSQNLAGHGGGVVVGGGNWQDNATNLGTFNLRQTLASILPPPGYSRTRPHVWALSLPTGAVHLFQVGTPEICKEFVTTSNYWSARLSTHPLVGGISNVEYGWSDAIVNNALVSAINETDSGKEDAKPSRPSSSRPGSSAVGAVAGGSGVAGPGGGTGGGGVPVAPLSQIPSSQGHRRRSSAQSRSSLRSSIDHAVGRTTTAVLHGGGKLPGDRINISEWSPPQQSMRPSNMPEKEQLSTLQDYVRGIEEELQTHNQLRSPMLLAFTPRGHNAARAMQNWERKSSYLLREIVKFRTYVDVLVQAERRKDEIYREREGVKREVSEALGMEFPMPSSHGTHGAGGSRDGNGRLSQSAPVSGAVSSASLAAGGGGSGRATPGSSGRGRER